MNRFLGRIAKLLVSALILLSPLTSQAQEWSPAQKDVWKNVEAYWALDAAGNTDGFLAYFHPDYAGWSLNNPAPTGKATATKFITYQHKTSKTIVYDLQPAAIKIHGNVAFVHYHYVQINKDAAGKDKETSGRWTDILMKQGDKWLLIGDNGGRTSKD